MSIYYSPLRYPGGKNCIFPFMAQLFRENRLIGTNYAEPYAGGSGLALRLLAEGYVERIYINDLDRAIFAFWESITKWPDEFCRWIEDVEISVENWKKFKKIQGQGQEANFYELAQSIFFLNRTNVSGIVKGGIIGGLQQKGKYKIDARFNKSALVSRIQKISSLSDRISISNLDGVEFVKRLNKKNENVFVYLDPPYFQKGAHLYMNFYSELDHRKLSLQVQKLKKKWLVSYDHHEFILGLYSNKRKLTYRLSQSASNRVGDELFIFSDKVEFSHSMSALKFPVFIGR